jgi:hypothetical protein
VYHFGASGRGVVSAFMPVSSVRLATIGLFTSLPVGIATDSYPRRSKGKGRMIEIQRDDSPGKFDRIGADRQGIDDGQHSPLDIRHLPQSLQ